MFRPKATIAMTMVLTMSVSVLPTPQRAFAQTQSSSDSSEQSSSSSSVERIHQIRQPERDDLRTGGGGGGVSASDFNPGTPADEIREAMETPTIFVESSSSSSESSVGTYGQWEGEEGQIMPIMPMPPVGGHVEWQPKPGIPPFPQFMVVDDGDINFSETGPWDHSPLAGYLDDFHYVAGVLAEYFEGGKGEYLKAKATWNFNHLKPGKYDVYATWVPYKYLSDSAPYKIRGARGETTIREVDQTQEPVGVEYGGRPWQKISTVKVTGGFMNKMDINADGFINDGDVLGEAIEHEEFRPFPWPLFPKKGIEVTLTNNTEGYVVADGVMIKPHDGPSGDTGNLYITKSPVPVRNHQLLGGTLSDPVMRLRFRADNIEPIDVTDIRFDAGTPGTPAWEIVDRLELFFEGESQPFAMATQSVCVASGTPTAEFCANMVSQQLVIQEGESKEVLVRARMKTDETGSVSGRSFQLRLGPENDSVLARGYDSSNNLSQNDQDNIAEGEVFIGMDTPGPLAEILGTEHVSVLSKFASITNANPDSDGTAVPVGTSSVGQFKFTAVENDNVRYGLNSVNFEGIVFDVDSTNVQFGAGGFSLYNKSDQTQKILCQETGVQDSFLVLCSAVGYPNVDLEIDSGDYQTLVLEANITDPMVSPTIESSLQVSISDFSDFTRTVFGTNPGDTHMRWRDADAGSSRDHLWIEYPEDVVRSTRYGDHIVSDPDLSVAIDGPPTQDYQPDDNDAVLAYVDFQSDDPITIEDMYVLVEGGSIQDGEWVPVPTNDFTTLMEDVELRDRATGQTVNAIPRPNLLNEQGNMYYQFSNFVTHNDDWELRVDFIDNGPENHPKNGDQYRVRICTDPGHLPYTCVNGIIAQDQSGDTVDSIHPGGIVMGNFHRIATAGLRIAMKSLGSSDTAVENEENINFMRFEARAAEAEDILFTKVVVEETGVDADLNNIQNYALWVDTDGNGVVDTILEDGVAAQSGNVTFNDLAGGGYVVPAEVTVVFEIHGDTVSTLSTDELQLTFEQLPVIYIEAEELDDGSNLEGIQTDGVCPSGTCQIVVTTTDSIQWYFQSQGDLYAYLDSIPVRNRQVLGGTLSEYVMRLEMRSSVEPVDVTDLQITVEGDAQSIDRMELYKDGESTPFMLATMGACGNDNVLPQTFCAQMESRQLVVDDQEDVIIRLRMKNDDSGAVSGGVFNLKIDGTPVSDESDGRGAVRARGDVSSNNIPANDEDSEAEGEVFIGTSSVGANADIIGRDHVSVLAKVTSITNANPDPNGSSVPVGVSDVGQFKIAAAMHSNSKNGMNDVVLEDLIFNMNGVNVEFDASGFSFFNKSDSTTTVTCVPKEMGGDVLSGTFTLPSFVVVCEDLNAIVDTEIDQGSDQTFVLQVNITNPMVNGGSVSTLQASLSNFSSMSRTTFSINDSHVRWLDRDTSSTEFLWIEYPDTVVKSTSYQS